MNMIKAEIQELHRERVAMLQKLVYWIQHNNPSDPGYNDAYEEYYQLQESVNELAGILEWMGG